MSSNNELETVLSDTMLNSTNNFLNSSRYVKKCTGTVVSYDSSTLKAVITYATDSSTEVTLKNASGVTLITGDIVTIYQYGTALQNAEIIGDLSRVASGGTGTGAVDSVNGQTGTVVLDADDISDSSTTHKFLSPVTTSPTTSSVSPANGGTFTAIDSITTDSYGRVTAENTKTITLPNSSGGITSIGTTTPTTINGILKGNGSTVSSATADTDYQSITNGQTTYTSIVDNDYVSFYSSVNIGNRKSLWSNIKSVLKTYYDTLYATVTHTHGNITNGGLVGTTSGVPLITGTGGIVQAGSFSTTSGTYCQGNDSRLSDSRTPIAHTQTSSTITDFASSVLATVVSGFASVASAAVTATDTITSAINKIQAQITANLSTLTIHTGLTSTAHGAVSTNTASTLVARDSSGNFLAGTITASLTGLATKATSDASGNTITTTYAPLANPSLTGNPTAPTATTSTNTTQIATTAFVLGQASSTTPTLNGAGAIGTGTTFARADHQHALNLQGEYPYGVTTNSGNAYSISTSPNPTSYIDGIGVTVKFNANSSGAATLNWNSLGAKSIVECNGVAVTNVKANSIYDLVYEAVSGKFMVLSDPSKAPLASPTFTGTVTSPSYVSSVATGTSPLTVTSTTKVTNLNADQLDGYDCGNLSNNIPLNNGTINTGLFAQYAQQIQDQNNTSSYMKFWRGSQSTYDSIGTKDYNTIYFIL